MSKNLAAETLCAQLDIQVISTTERRGPMRTAAISTIAQMLARYGEGHTITVLRAITESDGNEDQLRSDTMMAVSDMVTKHPRWPGLGLAFIEAFDQIPLQDVRDIAKASGLPGLRETMGVLLYIKLEQTLGPSELPKRKSPEPIPDLYVERRREHVARRIAIGVELIELKKIAPWRSFGRLAHQRFRVDPGIAPEYMNVAQLYADRPEITSRLGWRALKELSSNTLPASIRQDIEAQVIAGARISGKDVLAARSVHPRIQAGRWPAEKIGNSGLKANPRVIAA